MSKITLINRAEDMVRLALFRTPVMRPTLGVIAWKIVSPPPGGSTIVDLPADFAVQGAYSGDPSKPSRLDTTTAAVAFAETTAAFTIDSIGSQDQQATGAVIHQQFTDLVLNEVRVVNQYPIGVEVSILSDGDPIYAPQVVWPGGLLLEDIRAPIHAAVVSQFTAKGQRLVQEEISQTQIEVPEGATVIVTGSQWRGYALSLA